MKKIVVGSKNPVKINAVREVSKEFFDEVKILSLDAPSRVSEMPYGEKEAIEGAKNRANFCLNETDADLSFGLEGYVTDSYSKPMFLSGWSVAINREGLVGIGSGGRIELPNYISKRIKKGEELGPLIDKILDEKGIKKGIGAIGILTKGKIPRKEAFKRAVNYSLVKFINADLYNL
ncbi:MAG: DUF84 family protein [Candidatus Woesearchaeota archaeon]